MSKSSRIPITDEMRAELELCKHKTGFGNTALFHYAMRFRLFQQNASLSPNVFNAILYGRVKTVIAADFDKVIEAYNAIPREMWGKSNALSRKGSRVPVTDGFKARLQAMLDASSITRAKLLEYYGAPPDLTSTKLGLILKRENTTMKGEHAAFLERVLERRSDQPDPPAAPCPRIPHAKPKPPKKEPYRSIKAGGADFEEVERAVKPYLTPHSGLTPLRAEDLDAMKRHKERTGISPKLLVLASPDAPLVIMHMQGEPLTMQKNPKYENAPQEVASFLLSQAHRARQQGVSSLMLDPGIGFGKRLEDNITLLNDIADELGSEYPLLIGASRKKMIQMIEGRESHARDRDWGSIATHLYSIMRGASMIRVHNVRAHSQAMKVWNALTSDQKQSDE